MVTRAMFQQVWLHQWRSSRALVLALVIAAFAAPLASVYYGSDMATADARGVAQWLAASRLAGRAVPVLALVAGLFVGMASWAADHAGRHVYALSLPVPRWQYVLLRFGAGAALLAAPVLGMGLGAVIATLSITLPEGVHAYVVQLTLRFALAVLVCFSAFFAISIATRRAAVLTLGTIGGLVVCDLLIQAGGGEAFALEWVGRVLTTWPGPLAILLSRWALFDV